MAMDAPIWMSSPSLVELVVVQLASDMGWFDKLHADMEGLKAVSLQRPKRADSWKLKYFWNIIFTNW